MNGIMRISLVCGVILVVLSTQCSGQFRRFTFFPPPTTQRPTTTTQRPTTTTTTPRPTTTTPRPTTTTTRPTTTTPRPTTTSTTTAAPKAASMGKGLAGYKDTSPVIAFSLGLTNSRRSLSSGDVINFNKEVTNIGQAYDVTTGLFTCDVPGLYMFTLTILGFEQSPVTARLIVNGIGKMDVAVERSFGATSSTGTVFLQLSQGDKVAVINANSVGHKIQSLSTSFSGVLLRAM